MRSGQNRSCRLAVAAMLAMVVVMLHFASSDQSTKAAPRRLREWWGGDDDKGLSDDDSDDDTYSDDAPCSGSKIRAHSFTFKNATSGIAYKVNNFTNSCEFANRFCGGKGEGLLAYMHFHYCTMAGVPALSLLILILWLLLIISLLATTADYFFVPQLETLSNYLNLSPDIAGITLLALGNGAPDVFAAKAALDAGKDSDFPLMLSDLLGASVFISTVVLGSVCWVSNNTHENWVIDKASFWRDIVVYIIAVVVILVTASDGNITQAEAGAYLAIYFIYIAVVVIQSNFKMRQAKAAVGGGARTTDDSDSDQDELGVPEELEEPLMQKGEEEEGDGNEDKKGAMFGLDWDPNADRIAKVQFILEYPFSVLRWLSCPGADCHWDRRRRLWTCASPPFTLLVIILDSPWNGNNGLDYIAYGALGGWKNGEPQGFSIAALCVILGLCGSVVMYLLTSDDKLPSFYPLIVFLAFLSTIMWLDFIANELVAIIEALGRMMDISTSILGLTIIAMGNSVGDLVADCSTARNISPKMGVASCFGSPLLNDILGIGIATVIYTSSNGDLPSPLNAQDRVAYVFLFMSLFGSAAFFPINGYKSDRRNFYSFALFFLYGLFMLFSCLVESDVISKSSICKWGGNYKSCMAVSTGG